MASVKAICISEKKGTEKHPIESVRIIENYGLENDAHAGDWHRQVSLLSYETREEFNALGGQVDDGAFGENLLIDGIDFVNLPVGSLVTIGDVELQITQIGKACHSHCAIYHRVGKCIMPTNGVFARVNKGGVVKLGDEVKVDINADPRLRVAILTMSDKASKQEREDLSGPAIQKIMEENGYLVTSYNIISDDERLIVEHLIDLADRQHHDLILTTGGTGLSVRDVTPEATLKVATRNVPGISEAIRYESMKYTNRAMLSRGVSVLRNQTLIINLPGSVKAVKESLEVVLPVLEHALHITKGLEHECGRK